MNNIFFRVFFIATMLLYEVTVPERTLKGWDVGRMILVKDKLCYREGRKRRSVQDRLVDFPSRE